MDCNAIPPIITYAPVASVLVALILMVITGWYAYQTKRMVGEMKKGRIEGAMPILIGDVELDFTKKRDLLGEFNNIVIQNSGNSPAIEAKMELLLKNPDTSNLKIEPQQWFLGVIGLHNQLSREMKPCNLNLLKASSADPRIEITLTCKSVYGIISKTVSTFELRITQPCQAIDPKERFHWEKLTEKVDTTWSGG